MNPPQQTWSWTSAGPAANRRAGDTLAARLLTFVDGGLAAIICAAPFVFGGRHDLGRLVFVSLVAVTAAAWFLRQCILPEARVTRTKAYWLLALAIALVAVQLVPLPLDWLTRVSPRMRELLPMWTSGDGGLQLGSWSTLTLTPRETKLALAMLVSYALLITVLLQRIEKTADVERILNLVAISAVLMAAFGLIQFFASNGKYFWFYLHPYRTTDRCVVGSFMNRNHFASFLVLGVGPLVLALVRLVRQQSKANNGRRQPTAAADLIKLGILLVALAIVFLAILLSYSRGGALALVTATVTISVIYLRCRLVDAKYLYGLAGIGVVMLGLLSVYGYEQLTDRLDDLATGSIESVDHDSGRRRIWSANVDAISEGGPVGAGAGSHLEICPVYLTTPSTKEYTHAENGYLQIVTENGWLGGLLLAASIGFVAALCLTALNRCTDPTQQLCLGAAIAGMAASLVHSLFDFVWYIPACMSVTLVLAVCAIRLAQSARSTEAESLAARIVPRSRCIECGVLATLLAAWSVVVYIGPGVAAVHWDRYLRDAVAGGRILDDLSLPGAGTRTTSELATREPLELSMQRHLQDTLSWDPSFARAHLRLAARYVQEFESSQQEGQNTMTPRQIRDAVFATQFASPAERDAWLERAFGKNVSWLVMALNHARQAARLSPLEGDAYVFLTELGFLAGDGSEMAAACVRQAQCVRPYDGDIGFEAGRQALAQGDVEQAMLQWSRCYRTTGDHQLRIVGLLAGRIPAGVFVECLQPDWRTLRAIWTSYQQHGQRDDLVRLVAYADQVTRRDSVDNSQFRPAYLWLWLAQMHSDLDQHDEALDCLQQAYSCDPHVYDVRYLLANLLKQQGKYFEAEPHLRWCLARRPDDRSLSNALLEIAKQRLSQQDTAAASSTQRMTKW